VASASISLAGAAPASDPSPRAAADARGLTFAQISKHYGHVKAVDAVDLQVARGEFLTLLGPSGSGKTTMLMMIAGFVAPTAGQILLDGRDITHLPPEKRDFGMVFQGYALFPHLSVFDNVAFPLKVRRRPVEQVRAEVGRALDLVQLGHLATRMPRQLSGGQQQRVALARALVFTPNVLLLDEPLGALDRKLRTEVQIELKQLHARIGTTFVYVTHDQEEALSMSDRIAIVRDGSFVQIGSPTELYERPATRFVAGFLGESNFLSGLVQAADGGSFIYTAGGDSFRQNTHGGAQPAVGASVLLAMRPEKVAIGATPSSDCANRVSGRVSSWNYFGSDFHFTVETASLGRLAVRCPAWRMRIEPQNDMDVWLGWDDDAAVVIRDD
jgi:putative spermidine/putrescine transport system ATP-binding protein